MASDEETRDPKVREWFREAVRIFEEEVGVGLGHLATEAFIDQLLAHMVATRRLERVTHPRGTVCSVLSPHGRELVVEPGNPAVVLDNGRALLLVVEG